MGADRKPYYAVTYRYSWVFDDDSGSGWGDHITNWSETTIPLAAKADRTALREARAFVASERAKEPNRGFGLVRVEYVVPEIRREVPLG